MDNLVYRWKPSPMRGYTTPMMSFVAHLDGIPRNMKSLYSTLEVTMWEKHCSIITPQIAANLIQGARRCGWVPDKPHDGSYRIGPDQAAELIG